ncbi:CSN1 protein, partial [Polypterus senegalus]
GAVEPMQIDADPQEDQQNAPDTNYVVENPTLDLEQYASSYSGLMRIERLQFIADHCPQLRIEALKMALSFVQRTFNVDVYEEIHRKLTDATRRGHDDLGDHYLDCGDLSNALKCYSRARDYCTSAKHVINMCLNVIKVSVYLQNWSHVLSYVSKAESTPEIAELLSPSNVAVYGGLCALATFDRQELQRNVISSSSFKLFLELEPQVRDIIFKFYESKYASCLKMLDEMKYFSPYVSADMYKMATAFNTTVGALEDELTQLILEGLINARIDSHSKSPPREGSQGELTPANSQTRMSTNM